MKDIILGIYLGIHAVKDRKKGEICLTLALCVILYSQLHYMITGKEGIPVLSLGICMFLAGIALFSAELGMGDVLVLWSLAYYLEEERFLLSVTWAFFLSALGSFYWYRKGSLKREIPWIPYLFLAHTGVSIHCYLRGIL